MLASSIKQPKVLEMRMFFLLNSTIGLCIVIQGILCEKILHGYPDSSYEIVLALCFAGEGLFAIFSEWAIGNKILSGHVSFLLAILVSALILMLFIYGDKYWITNTISIALIVGGAIKFCTLGKSSLYTRFQTKK